MITPDPSTGAWWRKRKMIKAKNKKTGSCPGKTKGANCQTTSLLKYICGHNRSYKHKEYDTLLARSKNYYPASWR